MLLSGYGKFLLGFKGFLSIARLIRFSTGNGNGLFGLEWSLSIPGIARKTSKGILRYCDQAAKATDRGTFILSCAEDLIFVRRVTDEVDAAADKYRLRTDGLFAEIHRYRDFARDSDFWRVRTKEGLVSY
jgi:hypothetical protein